MIVAAALDLGTTNIKLGLLAADGSLVQVRTLPAPVVKEMSGRYESDAWAYVQGVERLLEECNEHLFEGLPLGLSSQRSSFLLWERESGKPVTPLISWQDARGSASCDDLREHEGEIRSLSGLPLTPYYLGPKLRVVLREHSEWREQLLSGAWLLGTLDTYLVWRWTGGACHLMDASMAARTQLLDIEQGAWSARLCEWFEVPLSILPRVVASEGMKIPLSNGLLLQASLGDQSAALLAGMAPEEPAVLVNLGTGGFVICYRSPETPPPSGYLQTLVWQAASGRRHVASEGTLNSIAAALAPYPVQACRVDEMGQDDIFCLAEPSGLGAPYFRGELGVTFSEQSAGLSQHQIARLLQEAIVFRVARILETFRQAHGIEQVYLSGGLSALPCLQQGIAVCSGLPVFHLQHPEASLLGAARLAAGMAAASAARGQVVIPNMPDRSRLLEKYRRWQIWLDEIITGK